MLCGLVEVRHVVLLRMLRLRLITLHLLLVLLNHLLFTFEGIGLARIVIEILLGTHLLALIPFNFQIYSNPLPQIR